MRTFSIVVAYETINRGIGYMNKLPWPTIKSDMQRFRSLTMGNIVIMGNSTFSSLGCRRLPDRTNIILSRNNIGCNYRGSLDEVLLDEYLGRTVSESGKIIQDSEIFVIGGQQLYEEAILHPMCDKIYITEIDGDFACDKFFPDLPSYYKIIDYKVVIENEITMRFLTYKNNRKSISEEMQYLQLARNIIENGEFKDGRNGSYVSIFGDQQKFNLDDGFPLLTTKRMFVRGIIEELLFFLRGNTDTNLLADKGVNIWNSNTTTEFHKKCGLEYEPGDMGPMYGYNWRYFGKKYTGMNDIAKNKSDGDFHDQLRTLLTGLKNDPFSRRHLLTTYDPSTVSQCVLPPCHGLIVQFYVRTSPSHNNSVLTSPSHNNSVLTSPSHNNSVLTSPSHYLDCKMYQRSVDVALGYPFNIASYAYLTHIICKVLGYKPGFLIMTLGDAHLYESHLDAIKLQLEREPYAKPQVSITKNYEGSTIDDMINYIENLQYEDFKLQNYKYHPRIKMQMVA